MMRIVLIALMLSILTSVATALEYEEKPDIAVSFIGSNHLERGDEKTIILSVYNDAKREKVKYDPTNLSEAAFFSGREDMLFTAYNVEFELEGNDYIEVKTPPQKIPAMPPMQPITLQFLVKVSDEAEKGEYELNLKVTFERINDLTKVTAYINPATSEPYYVPTQVTYEISNQLPTGNGSKTYEYRELIQEYELDYFKTTKNIPVTVYIEEKDVSLEIVDVKTENMVAGEKGKIEVTVRNTGGKTAKNAYLVLDVPSGFEASALSISAPSAMPAYTGLPAGMAGMPMTGMTGIAGLPAGGMPSTSSTSLSTAKAAYYIGELKPGDETTAKFYVKLNIKDEGSYPLQIKAVYLDEYGILTESESVSFGIDVAPPPEFEVVDIQSKIFVNAKGDLVVKLTSSADLEDASVILTAQPPLSVLSSEYFVGDIKAGEEFETVFKLKASSEAKPVTYPAELIVKYRSMDEYVESDPVRIGVKVNPKVKFEVTGTPSIAAGEERILTFTVRNMGNFEVRDATARITIVDPFSSSDDTAYIGNLKPGEAVSASFKISADKDATPKLYALNLEVKYRDLEDEWAISEPVKATINVTPAKPPYLIYGAVAAVIIIAVAAYLRSRR